jgi:D-alanine-D-alanine ligase
MKIKLGVFFGGKSVEHEIAIITYTQALESINNDKYEVVPIYISKQGVLYTGEDLFDLENFKDMDVLLKRCYPVTIVNTGKTWEVVRVHPHLFSKKILNTIDVAFPIVHGTNCEDGTVAGYLNLLGIPYVGPDVLASSIGMDKILMKKVLKESGLPVVDYVSFYSSEYIEDEERIQKLIAEKLRFPLIVKPGNLGSSVGIKKAKDENELYEAIDYAMEFSDRVIVEEAVQNLKEINCSVMGNLAETEASVCEEPWFSDEILSYADKYMGGNAKKGTKGGKVSVNGKMQGSKGPIKGMAGSKKKLPADISDEKSKEIQEYARETFKVLGCSGVARIDFLMDSKSNKVYVNEINTIPGALSFYLWEATGKSFEKEIDELVNIALRRDQERQKLTFSYDSNILAMQGGTKGQKGAKGRK